MDDLSHIGAHINVRKHRFFVHLFQLVIISLIAGLVLFNSYKGRVVAADIINRSIRISTPIAGSASRHTFSFNIAAGTPVGSIAFEYCSNSPLPYEICVPPAGLDAGSPTLASQSGQTGFSLHANTSVNRIVIARPVAVTTGALASYAFSGVINHTDPNSTVYARISAYSTSDGTGVASDTGSVAYSTTRSLVVNVFVPPYLTFCVGVTVAPDCSGSSGFDLDMGVLRANNANTTTSQFAGATNDFTGYTVFVEGNTMTAGTHVIPALAAPAASIPGAAQFGLNVRANNSPSVGQNPQGIGTAVPVGGYAVPDLFKFTSGEAVAQTPISSDFNVFTVSYLVNVPTSQAPGVYTTTLSYIATASF